MKRIYILLLLAAIALIALYFLRDYINDAKGMLIRKKEGFTPEQEKSIRDTVASDKHNRYKTPAEMGKVCDADCLDWDRKIVPNEQSCEALFLQMYLNKHKNTGLPETGVYDQLTYNKAASVAGIPQLLALPFEQSNFTLKSLINAIFP